MALISCPECGMEVSSGAIACPGCAYPVAGGTPVPGQAITRPSGSVGSGLGPSSLEVTKQIVGRVLLGGAFFASGIGFEAPPVVIGALIVWGSSLPIWIKARRAEKIAMGEGRVGRGGRSGLEERLEQQIAELEDRHLQEVSESEDRHQRQLADLEERIDFAERLLTKQRE